MASQEGLGASNSDWFDSTSIKFLLHGPEKLYSLSTISPGLSFLGCEMDVWERCPVSLGAVLLLNSTVTEVPCPELPT